ncbi:hypothetical protein NWF32_23120 [Pseudomonas qingdaonensis]|nr:hypothetical protein [Pseudomonas qingdaonensis]
MLAHGGGKDSSFALAFLRAAQLSVRRVRRPPSSCAWSPPAMWACRRR